MLVITNLKTETERWKREKERKRPVFPGGQQGHEISAKAIKNRDWQGEMEGEGDEGGKRQREMWGWPNVSSTGIRARASKEREIKKRETGEYKSKTNLHVLR